MSEEKLALIINYVDIYVLEVKSQCISFKIMFVVRFISIGKQIRNRLITYAFDDAICLSILDKEKNEQSIINNMG